MRLKLLFQIFALQVALCTQGGAFAGTKAEMSHLRETLDWPAIKKMAETNLRINQQDHYSLECLIEAHIQMNDFVGARKKLARLPMSAATPEKFYYLFALVEQRLGNLSSAKQYVEKLLSIGTTNATILTLVEEILFESDRARWLEVFIRNRHFQSASWYLSGGTTGDHAKATKDLKHIIEDPKLTRPHEFVSSLLAFVPREKLNVDEQLMMALALAGTHRSKEAIEWCKVADKNPRGALTAIAGVINSGYKPLSPLLPILKRIERANAGDAVYWRLLANVYLDLDRYDESIRAIDRSIAIDPNETSYWFRYRIYLTSRALGKVKPTGRVVLESLDDLIRAYPSAAAYIDRALLHHEMGMYDDELEDITHVLRLSRDAKERAKYMIRQADLQYAVGDLRSAMRTVEQILSTGVPNEHCLLLRKRMQQEMARAEIE